MMASSSSSSLCDLLLQDDLPWPSMPCAPALHTFGVNHQWSQPPMLDQFNSYEPDESLLSVQGAAHNLQICSHQPAGAAPTNPPQAQLSTVLMMQELGFQWTADDDAATISRNNNMVANLDGSVLPTINVSRLRIQKPRPAAVAAAGDALEMLAASCRKSLAAAASMAGHKEHLHWPYGPPPPHLIQGPSSIDLQMGAALVVSAEEAAAAAAQGRGGRHGSPAEHKQQRSAAPAPSSKKPRLESRSSAIVPSFKARKEKLGDRIAALQQLVSPFGKTDTASVLMEAIGYIKFLQDQVETLSGPYLQRSANKNKKGCSRAAQQQQQQQQQRGAGEKEDAAAAAAAAAAAMPMRKLDLRSRGLCLVPLSCTSYVTNENGVWAQPGFRGN